MELTSTVTGIPVETTLFGFAPLGRRWGVSKDLLRRMAEDGELQTIYLGGRRLVPIAEVLRVEREGLGRAHKRGWKRGKK
jgi:hypothetical protein